MRRILVLVTVALVMALMMAFGAGAASAQVEASDQVEFQQAYCLRVESGKLFGSQIAIGPTGFLRQCLGGSPLGPTGPPQDF